MQEFANKRLRLVPKAILGFGIYMASNDEQACWLVTDIDHRSLLKSLSTQREDVVADLERFEAYRSNFCPELLRPTPAICQRSCFFTTSPRVVFHQNGCIGIFGLQDRVCEGSDPRLP